MSIQQLIITGATLLGGLLVYELIRYLVVRAVKGRLRRSTKRFIQRHGVRLDRFKLTRRSFMKAELLSDPHIAEAISLRAAESGESPALLREQVEGWIDEIVPAFSVLSYYKLGYNAARFAIRLVYDVVIDRVELQRLRSRTPEGCVVVYMMNHRSNADYVLVPYMLARNIAVAFAVGEWARVWPLDRLFRSFGSYFVRRGFRDPLYHAVLRRYVQMTCRYGITQGVFPEGGLSRDGYLRQPKIGLVDYIIRIKEAGFESDVLFVPVGINYDRVLEDRALLGEARRGAQRPGAMAKLRSLLTFAVRFPTIVLANLVRVLTGRVKRHGYATASFGEPISLNHWLEEHPHLFSKSREDRKAAVGQLTRQILEAIAEVIPVTPVPLVALAASDLGERFRQEELLRTVRGIRDTLVRRNARLVADRGFELTHATRARLNEQALERPSDLLRFEDELTAADESAETVRVGLELLQRRGLLKVRGGWVHVRDPEVLAYYARSIEHLTGRRPALPPAPALKTA